MTRRSPDHRAPGDAEPRDRWRPGEPAHDGAAPAGAPVVATVVCTFDDGPASTGDRGARCPGRGPPGSAARRAGAAAVRPRDASAPPRSARARRSPRRRCRADVRARNARLPRCDAALAGSRSRSRCGGRSRTCASWCDANTSVGTAWLLRPKRVAHRMLYRTGAPRDDGIIVVSDDTVVAFRDAVGYRGDKIHVVANAADVERHARRSRPRRVCARARASRPTDHVMTMVGTFKRQKGHTVLIGGPGADHRRVPELHVLLVGDGELSATSARRSRPPD